MCIEIFENYTSDIEQEMFDKKRMLAAYENLAQKEMDFLLF